MRGMYSVVALGAALALCVASSGAEEKAVAAEKAQPAAKVEAIKRGVHVSQESATKAILAGDAEGLTKTLSAGFTTAGGDFQFESRDEFVKGLRSGQYKFESIKTQVEDVRVVNPHTAVVVGRRAVKGVVAGKEFVTDYKFKAVYVLEGTNWKAVLWAVNGGC